MDNRQQSPTPAPQEQAQDLTPMAQLPYPPQTNTNALPDLKPIYQPIDSLFALISLLLGFLFIKAIPVIQNPLGAMLCLLSWYLLGITFLINKGVRPQKRTVIYAAIMLILSFGMITGGNGTVRTLLFLGLMAAYFYWCYVAANLDGGKLFATSPFAHLMEGIFALPLSSMDHLCPALIAFQKKNENTKKLLKSLGWIVLGLLIAILPTVGVVLLLSYDQQFTSMLENIFSLSFDRVWKNLWQLALGFAFALLLFGALYGVLVRAKRKELGDAKEPHVAHTHVVPGALLCAAATPLLVVYGIFFLSQWDYYVSAFTHRLPDGLTYAAYAREGFFQLCIVCALNAVVLLLFNLLICKKEGRDMIKRIYSVIISSFTLILIATAISKMVLYISYYGLTQKRVYASWLMLLLAVIFVITIIAQINRRFRLFRAAVIVCLVFAALITLPDVDGAIASYNVDAYLSGKLNTVDVASIAEYGASSVPALVKLEKALTDTPNEETADLLTHTKRVLTTIDRVLAESPDNLFSFNLPDARAKRLLSERTKSAQS